MEKSTESRSTVLKKENLDGLQLLRGLSVYTDDDSEWSGENDQSSVEALPQILAMMPLHYLLDGSIIGSNRYGTTRASSVAMDAASSLAPIREHPPRSRVVLTTIALCLAVFCMALDNTIIATAIPAITEQFQSIDDIGWYGSGYLLTTCAFQLFFGKLYTFLDIKWVYLTAIFIFEVGSVLCAAANSSMLLIIGRAIAGLGSAGILSGALLIIAYTVPLSQRPLYTSLVGSMYGIASISGPLIGGIFTDHLSWRWCFYINLPIGAVAVAFTVLFFKSPEVENPRSDSWIGLLRQLDVPGLCLFLPCVVACLLALQWGGSTYAWSNWRLIILWVSVVVLSIAFVIVEVYMGRDATLAGYIIKQRTIVNSTLFAFFLGASYYTFIYILPIWFQLIKGASATKSGIMNLPSLVSLIIFTILAGACVTKLGYYTPFCIASAALTSIGGGLMFTWTVNTGPARWIGYQVIFGIGIGLGFQQPLIAVQAALPMKDVAMGTANVTFGQCLGGTIFLSAAQNVFLAQLTKLLVDIVPGLTPEQIVKTGALGVATVIPPEYAERALVACNIAITRTFVVGLSVSCAALVPALLLEWKNVKDRPDPDHETAEKLKSLESNSSG